MRFPYPLIAAKLVKRYKRFLADVELLEGPDKGSLITVHCANPGSMAGLTEPGIRVWISDSKNPKRKLQYSLEIVEIAPFGHSQLVGVNTNMPNKIAEEAITNGLIPQLSGYPTLRREVKYGQNSRIDLLLEGSNIQPNCFVEVKNVHFQRTSGLHEFPDSVTARGAKHLVEMAQMVREGHRAAMLYVIQRNDGTDFSIAQDMDPVYAKAFKSALVEGVEAYAIQCQVSIEGIEASDPVNILNIDR